MKTKEYSPTALGVKNVNLKATNDTVYSTDILPLGSYTSFLLSLVVTKTGSPNAGEAKITATLYANDETTVLGTIDVLTAIPTQADRKELVVFGRGVASAKSGNGTLGADVGIL